jgi:hypothetical protein
MLTKSRNSKKGSELTSECVESFNFSSIPPSIITPIPSDKRQAVKEQLILLTNKMIGFYEENNFDEKLFVQPNTFNFLQTICELYLPSYLPGLRLVKKATDKVKTEYFADLFCADGKIIHVSGETDSTLLYWDIPVAIWEDKNLTFDLSTRSAIGQGLVEVMGTSRRCREFVQLPLDRYTGILTTGLVWSLIIQSKGTQYITTVPIATYKKVNDISYLVDDDNIEIVTSLLIYHLQAIKTCVLKIVESHALVTQCVVPILPDDPDNGDKYEDRRSDDSDFEERRRRWNASSQEASMSKKRRRPAENVQKSSKKSGNQGKGKGNTLQLQNPNAMLTHENILRHDAVHLNCPYGSYF